MKNVVPNTSARDRTAAHFTTLMAGDEHRLAKYVKSVDDISAADDLPYECHFISTDAIESIDDLHATLSELRARPSMCVIRGEPIEGVEQPCRRLLKPRTENGVLYPATIRETPQAWMLVDFDSMPEQGGVDFTEEPARCAEHARQQLPSAFHSVSQVGLCDPSAVRQT